MPCGIKRCPPTPFDFNQLHHNLLSRQRSRVRVSSSPPFLIKHLRLWKSFPWAQKGTNSARGVKFRGQLLDNNVYVLPRPTGLIARLRALDRFYSSFPTISETTAVWAVRLAAVTAWV